MVTRAVLEVLADIFENTEALYKIEVTADPVSRDVVITYPHMDAEWFKELAEALGAQGEEK